MDILQEADGITEQYRAICEFIEFLRLQFDDFAKEEDNNIKVVIDHMKQAINLYEANYTQNVCGFLRNNVTFH